MLNPNVYQLTDLMAHHTWHTLYTSRGIVLVLSTLSIKHHQVVLGVLLAHATC